MKPGQYHGKDVFSYSNGVNTACRGKSHLRMKKGMIEEIIRTRRVKRHPAQFWSLCSQPSSIGAVIRTTRDVSLLSAIEKTPPSYFFTAHIITLLSTIRLPAHSWLNQGCASCFDARASRARTSHCPYYATCR